MAIKPLGTSQIIFNKIIIRDGYQDLLRRMTLAPQSQGISPPDAHQCFLRTSDRQQTAASRLHPTGRMKLLELGSESPVRFRPAARHHRELMSLGASPATGLPRHDPQESEGKFLRPPVTVAGLHQATQPQTGDWQHWKSSSEFTGEMCPSSRALTRS